MPNEFDYKQAYETLAQAVREADRILRRTNLATVLSMRIAAGEIKEDLEEWDADTAAFEEESAPDT